MDDKQPLIGIAAPETVVLLPNGKPVRICSAGIEWADYLAELQKSRSHPTSQVQSGELELSGRKPGSGS